MTQAKHNHQIKIERMIEEGKIPIHLGLNDVDVYHDDWCKIFQGGYCNCDPDIKTRKAQLTYLH